MDHIIKFDVHLCLNNIKCHAMYVTATLGANTLSVWGGNTTEITWFVQTAYSRRHLHIYLKVWVP